MENGWKKTEEAAEFLWGPVSRLLLDLPLNQKERVEEIRLRVNQPLSVYMDGEVSYVCEECGLTKDHTKGYRITKDHLNESFRKLCGYAVHSHEEEISQGYISVPGGHRAGLAGTGYKRSNGQNGLRDITSISLRVAREVPGSADDLVPLVLSSQWQGLLVAGPPGSGKTTVLRDLARQLSVLGKKVVLVDERGELSGTYGQNISNNLGTNSDVICGTEKSRGILMGIRCLSPQYIVCDELGSKDEIDAVCSCLCSGVTTITSIHAGNFDQLRKKTQFMPLVRSGAFRWVAMLSNPGKPALVREVDQL
ncbi:MAG: DUF853 family protein [Oscillospiraceae bacterium]|nr:DUF853 family protein [Oscillospiraceae bacterium]